MNWLSDTDTSTDTKVVENNWLPFPNPETIGKKTEVRLRVLDEEPVGTWRHWFNKRPYNCPGFNVCPVCEVRQQASKSDPEHYKSDYRLDYRYFFNVLFEHTVKVWSFTPTVGRKLKVFEEKYGDLRGYDISVSKRKTGPLDQNIEYDVIFEEKSKLSTEDTAIAENRFDRAPFVAPADTETLRQVALGVTPVFADEDSDEDEQPLTAKPTRAEMIMLKTLIEKKGHLLSDFGIVETSPPMRSVVKKLIEELRQERP